MDLLSKNIHWALRLCLASTFILHGFPKLGNSVANLGYIGYLVGPFEVLGGILLVAGPYINQVLTKIGAAMIALIMLGAVYMHLIIWNDGWYDIEWQILIIAVCFLFILKGDEI